MEKKTLLETLVTEYDNIVQSWDAYVLLKGEGLASKTIPDRRTVKFSLAKISAPEFANLRSLIPEASYPNVYVEGRSFSEAQVYMGEYLNLHDWFKPEEDDFVLGERQRNAHNRHILLAHCPDIKKSVFLLDIFVSDQWDPPNYKQRLYLIYQSQAGIGGIMMEEIAGKKTTVRDIELNEIHKISNGLTKALQELAGEADLSFSF